MEQPGPRLCSLFPRHSSDLRTGGAVSRSLTCCLSSGTSWPVTISCLDAVSWARSVGVNVSRNNIHILGAEIQSPAYGEPGVRHGYYIQGWDQQASLLISSLPVQGCAEPRDKPPGGHIPIFGQVSNLEMAQPLTARGKLWCAFRPTF